LAVAGVTVGVLVVLEDPRRDAGGVGPLQRTHARAVRGDRRDRQACVDQGLQIRALPRYEDADQASSPITSAPAGASGTTAHMPMPRLKTLLSSSSATPRSASQRKACGRTQLSQSIRGSIPAGSTRERLPRIPPPVTWASARTSARAWSSRSSRR